MQTKSILLKIICLFFSICLTPSFAHLQIYQEYKNYIIKKGDTLWDISQKELNDPFLWPKVWKENPNIKNPDRIYPNQEIRIPLYLLQKEIPPEKPKPKVTKKPKPPEKKPLVETIKPKEKEYLINKNILIASGYIADSIPNIGKITDSPTDRTILGKNDYAYIKTSKPVQIGDKFYILDVIEKVKHPRSGKKVGYLIEILGIAEIVENSNDPKVLITTTFDEISPGNLLDNFYEIEVPPSIENPRKPSVDGYIIATRKLHMINGTWDIVYIDKGEKDGLEIGDLLATTLQSKHKILNGLIQLIKVGETTSTAIVKKCNREITKGDNVIKAN